jgi:hypothetical protein
VNQSREKPKAGCLMGWTAPARGIDVPKRGRW